jgi:plastocyanin
MQRFLRPTLALAVALALGACSASSTPSAVNSTAAAPSTGGGGAISAAPSTAAGGASSAPSTAGGAACAPAAAGATAAVKATIKDFAFSPEPVTAKVGDVIGWTNNDSAGHTATLDDGTCTTDTIANGATGSLTFTAAGTYAYHCKIHPTQMKGTITITG